ncbi:MAG: MucB/RseB C-terminal domain-containing protein [Oleiphilaceae bacterium]|nr:MucB/RseB C-terminal domain-containing protein [Oleiphilaceae bacterium]
MAINMNKLGVSCLYWFFTAALLTLGSGAALASQSATAEGWLQRLGPAMTLTTYQGVFVYARGELAHTMQIAHRYHNGQIEERLTQQDGASGEFLRKGDEVLCVLPDQGSVRLEEVVPSGVFAQPLSEHPMPDPRWYKASVMGNDRVAGYDAVKIALDARDRHRHSHRLWLEKDTGLLLKSHSLSATGKVLDRFQFTSLNIMDSLPDSEFILQQRDGEVAYRSLGDAPAAGSRLENWRLGWRPDGFGPAASPRTGGGQAVAFSDGLATFSVFVESTGDIVMPAGVSRIGATTAYMRHSELADASFLITVVGEVPPATAMRIAESVELGDSPSQETGAQDNDH